MKNILMVWVMCCLGYHSFGQVIMQPVGARYQGLGTYSQQYLDVYATRYNAASMASLAQPAVAAYAEQRFMLQEMNLYSFNAALPTNLGSFGLHGNYFGFDESNQSQLSFSYGRKLSSKINIGAAFHYNQIRQSGIYGNANAFTASVGLMMRLSEQFSAGINAYNPFRPPWNGVKDERLPAQYTFGLGYDAGKNVFISGELVQEEGQDLNVNLGMHYQLVKQFFIRLGISTQTSNYFAGLGFVLGSLRIDLATSYHPQLGFSPGILLLYSFGGKNENLGDNKTP